MKIVIGSTSEQKIKITEKIIRTFTKNEVQIQGSTAHSGVPETPFGKETFDGACNRAKHARDKISNADYYIGLESGLIKRYGHIYEEAWAAVMVPDGSMYYGYSSGLKVPDYILQKMEELKMSHSDVMAMIEREYGKSPNDTWSTYSGGLILRTLSLEEALRNAFIQIFSSKTSFFQMKK